MHWITRSLIGLCFLFITLLVSAQESHPVIEFAEGINDPRVNDSANACYYGGTLSGLCNTTEVNEDKVIDDLDRNWMWTAGWYLIRYEYNVFSRDDLEPTYFSILPPDFIHKIDGRSGCYGVEYQGLFDVYLSWPGGLTLHDVRLYENNECINQAVLLIRNVIAIETDEQAEAICDAELGEIYTAKKFFRSFYQCIHSYDA